MKAQARLVGIDILRVIAMACVVYLHTVYPFTLRSDFFATKAWVLFEPFAALSRSSLGLFFIISGYLVVHKNRTVTENLKVTFQRIVIPFLFFSAVIPLFLSLKTGKSIAAIMGSSYGFGNPTHFPENWLWFLEVLLVLYLLNPLWQAVFTNENRRNEAVYLTILFFVFTSAASLVKGLTGSLFLFNRFTTWTGFACFYMYGALMKGGNRKSNRQLPYFLMFLLGLALEIGGDYVSLMHQKNNIAFPFAGYFADDMGLPALLMAVGLFHLFINTGKITIINRQVSSAVYGLIRTVAVLSYGVYLMHEFIPQTVTGILKISIDSSHMNIYAYNIGLFTVTLVGSIVVAYIISRIPKVRMIIGIRS